MQKGKSLNAKNLADKIKVLAELGKTDLAIALLESREMAPFLAQITSILKRQKAKLDEYNTCKILTSKELSDDALDSILNSINYQKGDKLVKIVSPDLGVGAFVTYKGVSVDATLQSMINRIFKN